MQTKGGYSGHIQNLKRKGISACARVALRLPLTTMSLKSLERLLCTEILPSTMYGLALHESQMNEDDFQYLDVVQGRVIKAWFGVSKFCSTTALREAIGWKLASEVVVCHLRHGAHMGSFVEGTQSMPFGKDRVRRCMGMLLSNGLHHLECDTVQCYVAGLNAPANSVVVLYSRSIETRALVVVVVYKIGRDTSASSPIYLMFDMRPD